MKRLLAVEVPRGGANWSGTLFQLISVPAEKRLLIREKNAPDWIDVPWTTLTPENMKPLEIK